MFLFATFYTFNGLQAQMPGQVHGKSTDQEVQRTEEQEVEYESGAPEHKGRKDQAKENRGKGEQQRQNKGNGKAEKGGCQGDDGKAQMHGKAHQQTGKQNGQATKEEHGHNMKAGKEEMKDRKGDDKHHPIFYRRTDARNGKGEQH